MRRRRRCREEYETIVKTGLILSIDCPDLAMGRHTRFKNLTDEEFPRNAELQVEALHHALANVLADRLRMHICTADAVEQSRRFDGVDFRLGIHDAGKAR